MSDQYIASEGLAASGSGENRYLKPFFTLIAALVTFIVADLADGVPYLSDLDDRLRAIEVKQFLLGKGWYDLSINGISMPQTYISPWSRLVDAPYMLIASLLSHFMTPDQALQAAYHIWPPILLFGFGWFTAVTMVRLLPGNEKLVLLHVVAAALVMFYAAFEFDPGRIDHHNVQLVTLSAALAGVAFWSAAGGVLIAGSVALSVTVGLETLPLLAVLWVGLGLAWVADVPRSRVVFGAFSLSITLLAPAATLLFSGPDVLFHIHNDVFSAPYAAAFTGFGAISTAMTFVLRERKGLVLRLLSLALPGLLLLAVIIYIMPGLLAGPYKVIDPISRHLWLERVVQEHSVFNLIHRSPMILVITAAEAVVAIFAGAYVFVQARKGNVAPAIIYAVAVASLLATLDLLRFIRFPAAMIPLFIPLLLGELMRKKPEIQRRYVSMLGVSFVFFCVLFYGISYAVPAFHGTGKLEAVDMLTYDACTDADYAALSAMPAGKYMVPTGMAIPILETAPASIAVSNIGYHRSSPGIRRMFQTFYLTDAAARQSAMAPFGYLAFCTLPKRLKGYFKAPTGSLFEALLNGKPWPGLKPVDVPGAVRLKVFRVDHAGFK